MNNNRYNLRSSAQQQIAPSFYPTSSTTGGTTTGAGTTSTTTTTTTTSTTGFSSSSFLSAQPAFQTGQPQQLQAQPGQFIGQQQQQHLFADAQAQTQAQTQAQQSMDTVLPTHYQQGQGQVQPGQMALGGPAATAPFLQDFTLVAEAVKRVQMDAVMTEMESITL